MPDGMTMTDYQIISALQEVGAAWLMDQDDEACQTNALRHLVDAAVAAERERCAKLVEAMDADYLRTSPCRKALERAARAIRKVTQPSLA